MNKNKIMTGVLTGAMMLSMTAPVFAAGGTVGLTADQLADADKLDWEVGTYDSEDYRTATDNDTSDGVDSGSATSVVIVDAEATTFVVTVPIALHVKQDAAGEKTYKDDMADGATGAAKIINKCSLGQVKIENVQVVAATGYEITAMDADYANMKVNSKVFGFQINGKNVDTDGSLIDWEATVAQSDDTITSAVKDAEDGKTDEERVYADYTFTYANDDHNAFPVLSAKSILPITYRAELPAFSSAIEDVNVGGVIFTVNFN